MQVILSEKAKKDLAFFTASGNKNILKKIGELVKSISETPFEGMGQPEALKYNLSGFWSRRINQEHRLIYNIQSELIEILSMRGHY